VAASVHGGHATAALVVGKLCSSKKQQNTLTAAMTEYGLVRRTIYAARYLADETYQRRIGRQLNKGENVHTLRRDLAHQGKLRRRYPEQQTGQMWCLALATNAIVCCMAEYLGLAVAALRAPDGTSTMKCWRTCGPPTTRTCCCTAPTPSTSTPSSPAWTPPATGPCAGRLEVR
jgi:TnpA family transposase